MERKGRGVGRHPPFLFSIHNYIIPYLDRIGDEVERLVREGRGAQQAQGGGDVALERGPPDARLPVHDPLQVGEEGHAHHLLDGCVD